MLARSQRKEPASEQQRNKLPVQQRAPLPSPPGQGLRRRQEAQTSKLSLLQRAQPPV